jgi:hypothetical protein
MGQTIPTDRIMADLSWNDSVLNFIPWRNTKKLLGFSPQITTVIYLVEDLAFANSWIKDRVRISKSTWIHNKAGAW